MVYTYTLTVHTRAARQDGAKRIGVSQAGLPCTPLHKGILHVVANALHWHCIAVEKTYMYILGV